MVKLICETELETNDEIKFKRYSDEEKIVEGIVVDYGLSTAENTNLKIKYYRILINAKVHLIYEDEFYCVEVKRNKQCQ